MTEHEMLVHMKIGNSIRTVRNEVSDLRTLNRKLDYDNTKALLQVGREIDALVRKCGSKRVPILEAAE